ncbi:hypothetical protein ABW21_db0203496 [Orbilia brochopaga]|nr:hypothetical protein ABW21_db0203496 [Drechslerella brochopaga]
MDLNNILNNKESGTGITTSGVTASSSTQTAWPTLTSGEIRDQPQSDQQEHIRLPSLATSSYSTYPHAQYSPKYSFESQTPNPPPTSGSSRAYSPTATSGADPSLSAGDDSKPYHCKTCQKGFARRSDLSRHAVQRFKLARSTSAHSFWQTSIQMSLCGLRTTLTRHQNHHTGTIDDAARATAAALASRKTYGKPGAQSLQLTGSTAYEEPLESVSQSRTGPNSSLRLSEGGNPGTDLDNPGILAWRENQNYQAKSKRLAVCVKPFFSAPLNQSSPYQPELSNSASRLAVQCATRPSSLSYASYSYLYGRTAICL